MITRRPGRAWLGTGVVAVLAVLLGPSAAADRRDVVAVSADAVHWSNGLVAPLFDPDVRWVPGDRRTGSFYVRNGGSTPATLRLQVDALDDGPVRTGDLRFTARSGGAWVPLRQERASSELTVDPLPAGAHVRVDVRAAFDPASPNQSQQRATRLSFVVRLADAGAETGGLPSTGAPRVAPFVLPAAALIGLGLALVLRRREVRRG